MVKKRKMKNIEYFLTKMLLERITAKSILSNFYNSTSFSIAIQCENIEIRLTPTEKENFLKELDNIWFNPYLHNKKFDRNKFLFCLAMVLFSLAISFYVVLAVGVNNPKDIGGSIVSFVIFGICLCMFCDSIRESYLDFIYRKNEIKELIENRTILLTYVENI